MATQPKISAPIARVQLQSGQRKTASGDRWVSADQPIASHETEDAERPSTLPTYYPFAPRPSADRND